MRERNLKEGLESRNNIPSHWLNILQDSMNKQEHFAFLSDKMSIHKFLLSIARGTSHCMELCDHKEADTRMLASSLERCPFDIGSTTCLVCTVNTSVARLLS